MKLIIHTVEITRTLDGMAAASSSRISSDERISLMTRTSSPTRSELEEFSDRFFNIMSYNEDDRMIMILMMFISLNLIGKLQKLIHFVLATTSHITTTGHTHATFSSSLRQYFNDIEILVLLMATIFHDVDHHGLLLYV